MFHPQNVSLLVCVSSCCVHAYCPGEWQWRTAHILFHWLFWACVIRYVSMVIFIVTTRCSVTLVSSLNTRPHKCVTSLFICVILRVLGLCWGPFVAGITVLCQRKSCHLLDTKDVLEMFFVWSKRNGGISWLHLKGNVCFELFLNCSRLQSSRNKDWLNNDLHNNEILYLFACTCLHLQFNHLHRNEAVYLCTCSHAHPPTQ